MDKSNSVIKQEDFTSSFEYKGRLFVVDKLESSYLITESQHIINAVAPTLDEATKKIKENWDNVEHKYTPVSEVINPEGFSAKDQKLIEQAESFDCDDWYKIDHLIQFAEATACEVKLRRIRSRKYHEEEGVDNI